MTKLEQAREWAKSAMPDVMFESDTQLLVRYLREIGTPVQNKRPAAPLPELEPKTLIATSMKRDGDRTCPSCGGGMVRFNLCSMCSKAQEGYIAVWICPASGGIDSPLNLDERRKQTYRDYFRIYDEEISARWGRAALEAALKPERLCPQEPILEKEDEE